jgi:hypothetical protein
MTTQRIRNLFVFAIALTSLLLVANAAQFILQTNLSEELVNCENEKYALQREKEELIEKLEECEIEKEKLRRILILSASFNGYNLLEDE